MSSCWCDNRRVVFSIQINVMGGTKHDYLIPDIIPVYGKLRENLFFCCCIRLQEKPNTSVTLFVIYVWARPVIVRVSGNCTRGMMSVRNSQRTSCFNYASISLYCVEAFYDSLPPDLKLVSSTNKQNKIDTYINRQARNFFLVSSVNVTCSGTVCQRQALK
jgi:hypothetical protein